MDECEEGAHNCSEHAQCANVPGGFTCACTAGYVGSGVQCRDRDECLHSEDDCDENARCINLAGSFGCECRADFVGDGRVCDAIE